MVETKKKFIKFKIEILITLPKMLKLKLMFRAILGRFTINVHRKGFIQGGRADSPKNECLKQLS